MKQRIIELEKLSALLEPDYKRRKEVRESVLNYTESFLEEISESKGYEMTGDKGIGLLESPISDDPIDIDEAISLVAYNVDRPGLNPASGAHLGYIPGGGIYYSSLGDYMAAISNRYAGVFFASPGAVYMENMMIEWMAGLVGYPKSSGGNLTSGGSIAHLTAIVTARDAFGIKAKDFDKVVVYLSKQVHHCIDKALRLAGMGESIKRYIPLDEKYRIIPEKLEEAISKDKASGFIPWLIIASAGTTDTGAVDPLDTIGDIAKKFKLWYHIDGAYGGFFALIEEGKRILKGLEKSDSLVIDPHKTLFLPYGSGVVIVKDKKKLYNSQYYQANYMQDTLNSTEELSPADLSPELTKHFRGLRLWLPLKLIGLKPFKAALEEKLLLARYFYEEVKKLGFETGPYPQLSIVTFRWVPKNEDADKINEKLVNEIQKDGRVFISSTRLDGKFTLRLAIVSFRTKLQTVDLAIAVLKEKINLLLLKSND